MLFFSSALIMAFISSLVVEGGIKLSNSNSSILIMDDADVLSDTDAITSSMNALYDKT